MVNDILFNGSLKPMFNWEFLEIFQSTFSPGKLPRETAQAGEESQVSQVVNLALSLRLVKNPKQDKEKSLFHGLFLEAPEQRWPWKNRAPYDEL